MSVRNLNRPIWIYWRIYLLMTTISFNQGQNLVGGGFLADPFLDLSTATATAAVTKSNKLEPICVSDGVIAGAIIATLFISGFIAFLTWLTYIRPKFQELQYKQYQGNHLINDGYSQQNYSAGSMGSDFAPKVSRRRVHLNQQESPLPLDVTDCKFSTFPFRQSQLSNNHGHHNRNTWLHRFPSSFRSVNMDQNSEMLDIELLDPTFGGLNFSVAGNMRTGIYVKEMLPKTNINEATITRTSEQLKAGDRIVALTVCFESIVYEDALTILSYASPYPVILRIQRNVHPPTVDIIKEKQLTAKVKWRDEFEHYDNDSPSKHTLVQPPSPAKPHQTPPTVTPKKVLSHANTQPRPSNKKLSSTSITKGNKIKPSSTSIVALSGATTKRCHQNFKKYSSKNKPTCSVPSTTTDRKSNKRLANQEANNPSEEVNTPYYDSPYDCYEGQSPKISPYQYLHQSPLNKNNNNSLSTESLTSVTGNLSKSLYALPLPPSISHQHQRRRFSLPAVLPPIPSETMNYDDVDKLHEISIDNSDTFV